MNVKKAVLEAEKRIRAHIRETPLEHSPYLSQLGNCEVYLKLENIQLSGSFKLRGAANKYLSLTNEEKEKGITTASSGNHGMAVAYLLKKFGGEGTIYLPENIPQTKIEALRLYGANLEIFGDDCVKAEMEAKRVAQLTGQTWISPYNDPLIVAGQGTIAVELERQLTKIDSVLVPVGGGGLIAGIAGYLKSINNHTNIFGCQPENSCVMYESVQAGEILDLESKPTLADATAGGIENGSITLDICKENVDDFFLVNEDEIKNAIKLILEKHYLLIEGGPALAVASFIKNNKMFKGKNVVLILTGSKISLEQLKTVLFDN
jgi:threonine dehydratase